MACYDVTRNIWAKPYPAAASLDAAVRPEMPAPTIATRRGGVPSAAPSPPDVALTLVLILAFRPRPRLALARPPLLAATHAPATATVTTLRSLGPHGRAARVTSRDASIGARVRQWRRQESKPRTCGKKTVLLVRSRRAPSIALRQATLKCRWGDVKRCRCTRPVLSRGNPPVGNTCDIDDNSSE